MLRVGRREVPKGLRRRAREAERRAAGLGRRRRRAVLPGERQAVREGGRARRPVGDKRGDAVRRQQPQVREQRAEQHHEPLSKTDKRASAVEEFAPKNCAPKNCVPSAPCRSRATRCSWAAPTAARTRGASARAARRGSTARRRGRRAAGARAAAATCRRRCRAGSVRDVEPEGLELGVHGGQRLRVDVELRRGGSRRVTRGGRWSGAPSESRAQHHRFGFPRGISGGAAGVVEEDQLHRLLDKVADGQLQLCRVGELLIHRGNRGWAEDGHGGGAAPAVRRHSVAGRVNEVPGRRPRAPLLLQA